MSGDLQLLGKPALPQGPQAAGRTVTWREDDPVERSRRQEDRGREATHDGGTSRLDP